MLRMSLSNSNTARLAAQQGVVDVNAQAFDLSEARFTAGMDNYLTLLDAQRSLYAAQQALIGLRQSEQANRVVLWKVLGGQLASPAGQRHSVR
jgi:outer membrane protein TolC